MWTDYPCKIWTGAKAGDRYPHIWQGGKTVLLTRILLEKKLGHPIPEGQEACHHCDTTACIEPEHLWAGTHHQNMLDAAKKHRIVSGWAAANASKTHCPHGHEYTEKNTYISRGKRQCKKCKLIWARRNYKKKVK